MTYLPTEEDLALLKSRSKKLYCRIELLNKEYQIIDTIEGLALSGSNSIDADSDTRRTFNLDIFPKKGFSISQFSEEEWASKMLRLLIGMKAPTSAPYIEKKTTFSKPHSISENNSLYKDKDFEYKKQLWVYEQRGVNQYGNIDNINRPRIIWSSENKEKYADFIKEIGDIGTYSTALGSVAGYKSNNKVYQIAYTPLFVFDTNTIIPLLKTTIDFYIESIFNNACDSIKSDSNGNFVLSSKILELDKIGIDCSVYGENIRVKNMIAAIEGGVVANKTLTAADVAAISGCPEEYLQKHFNSTSEFVGFSMHDIQATIWEFKDGLKQIDDFYNTSYSIQTEVRSGTNYVDTNGIHWFGAGVYAIQQNGYIYDATTNKLSLSCLDLTCILDGTLGGTLTGYATRIPMYERKMTIVDGVKTYVDDKTKPHYIRSSIKETFELSGLTKSMVDYSNRCIPHDLEYSTGTTIWNILTELRDLHYPYEIFFDDDTFVCKEIPSGYDDPVVLDEEIFKSLVISENANVDYSKIHNCVEVWGASNSSNYFCKDKLEATDPEGTGTAKVCKKGTAEWNEIVQLLKDNDLNIGYNMDPNNTGACILLLELTQAEINDATRISFVCPETLPPDARVVIKNVITTTKYDSETDKEYKEITRLVYGPMMLFKASVNENGEDEPEDTTKLLAGKYYVIQYGTQYIDQAKEGAYAYKFNPEKGTYEKQELDPSVRYYTKEVYDSSTGRYVTKYYKHVKGSSYDVELTDPSMLVESRVYFIGQSQSHAMAKFVDSMPSDSQIAEDKINEACDNIEYVVVNDPNRTDDLYNSHLTIDKIGRRNLVCSGSEYDGYTSDESAMTVCKYTLWKNCRLTDSITLKMHLIPWLDVNEKVKYAAEYLKSDIAVEWIIKKIDSNIGDGTMNVTLSRYYPYYPHIVSKKTNSYKNNDNTDTDTPIIPPAEVSSVIKLGHGVLGRDTIALSSVPGISTILKLGNGVLGRDTIALSSVPGVSTILKLGNGVLGKDTIGTSKNETSNTLKTNMILDYTLLDCSVLDYD